MRSRVTAGRWGGLWVVLACLVAISSARAASPSEAPDPLPETPLSILFIGNSLTYFNDMPAMLSALLEAAGSGPVEISSSSFPNYGLQDHWVDQRTRAALGRGGWDYVVLQQGPSATEGRPSLIEYSARFAPLIKAAGGRPALYMVWPSARRDFDFDGVAESYTMAAEKVDGLLFPVGDAWRAAWHRRPKTKLYGDDGFHPSVLGSYLAAVTFADRLIGSALTASHVLQASPKRPKIRSADAEFLLAAAREANVGSR